MCALTPFNLFLPGKGDFTFRENLGPFFCLVRRAAVYVTGSSGGVGGGSREAISHPDGIRFHHTSARTPYPLSIA
jgi:hypothetical protein